MGTIGELGGHVVRGKNQTQFLGQDDSHNPLLELARGIEGNAATSQGRGDMAFGGAGGIPVLSSYTDPATGQQSTYINRTNFRTPTTLHAGGGVVVDPGATPPTPRPPRPGPGVAVASAADAGPAVDSRIPVGDRGWA